MSHEKISHTGNEEEEKDLKFHFLGSDPAFGLFTLRHNPFVNKRGYGEPKPGITTVTEVTKQSDEITEADMAESVHAPMYKSTKRNVSLFLDIFKKCMARMLTPKNVKELATLRKKIARILTELNKK